MKPSIHKTVLKIILPSLILLASILFLIYAFYFKDERELKHTSSHIDVYATKRDAEFGLLALDPLEAIYDKTNTFMGFDSKYRLNMTIFASYEDYADYIYSVQPRWRDSYVGYATAEGKNIKIVSPKAKDIDTYTTEDFISEASYELVIDMLNHNRYDIEKEPLWLIQGIAAYITSDDAKTADYGLTIQTTETPDFETILNMKQGRATVYNKASDAFGENGGLAYSYYMIHYILDTYSIDTLVSIYNHPDDYLTLLGFDDVGQMMADFEAYLTEKR